MMTLIVDPAKTGNRKVKKISMNLNEINEVHKLKTLITASKNEMHISQRNLYFGRISKVLEANRSRKICCEKF